MKLKLTCILFVSFCFHSCSKQELTPLNFEQVSNSQNEVFLVSTAVHSDQEAALFEIINEYRTSIGLDELTFEGASYYYAVKHSNYMIKEGLTSHDNFAERAEQIAMNTGATNVSENVAKDYDTIEEAFEAWLESEGHRINIEGDYTYSAISIRKNETGDLYFTQLFSR